MHAFATINLEKNNAVALSCGLLLTSCKFLIDPKKWKVKLCLSEKKKNLWCFYLILIFVKKKKKKGSNILHNNLTL